MELFTLNRNYAQISVIDYFDSAIWTERVRGDGDVQISVPATVDIMRTLAPNTFVGMADSNEVMMLETQSIKDGVLKVTGRSLCEMLNSRFVRFTSEHHDKSFPLTGLPGRILQFLVQEMTVDGDWLNGIQDMGIPDPARLKIPYLSTADFDETLDSTTIVISYGPLYDELKKIADAYNLVMKIERLGEENIVFRNWRGVDHTSNGPNELVRFSPQLDNFGSTTEVVDATKFKTHAWSFASGLPSGGGYVAGEDSVTGSYSGFDLRAELVFNDDITSIVGGMGNLELSLQQRSFDALSKARIIGAVDGTILPSSAYTFGKHYNLGDIVESQGTSGLIQNSVVTEYIRAHDSTGEKAYPTLVAVS